MFYLIRPAAGGMEGHLQQLMDYFGESCRLHLAAPGRKLAALAEHSGGRFYRLPLPGALRPRTDLQTFQVLSRALQETRPALLHTHGFKAALVGGVAACRAGTPLLVTVHNFPADPAGVFLPVALQLACGRRARYIAVSRALSAMLCRWGVDPVRITVIPNGIDAARFAGAAQRLRLAGRRVVVGTVARLAPQKGIAVFLRAAARLASWYPGLVFRVVGEGPERPALEILAARLGLGNRVEFYGHRENLPAELGAMDVFILPSLSEGLSIALLEAAAAACPIVASHCGGLPEVVEEGITGLLVHPGDPEALARRVAELLHRPGEARRMGVAAGARVRREFSQTGMLRKTAAIYSEMGAIPGERRGGVHDGTLENRPERAGKGKAGCRRRGRG